MLSELASVPSESVKFAFFTATTASVPAPPPFSVPVPVHPLTVKTLFPAPPVRFATAIPDSVRFA